MDLQYIRRQIDVIDKELTLLLEKRMALVRQVSEYKKEQQKAVADSARETAVLKSVSERVEDKEFEETIANIFADIMKHSRAYQTRKIEQ